MKKIKSRSSTQSLSWVFAWGTIPFYLSLSSFNGTSKAGGATFLTSGMAAAFLVTFVWSLMEFGTLLKKKLMV